MQTSVQDIEEVEQVVRKSVEEELYSYGFQQQAIRDGQLWYNTLIAQTNDQNELFRIQILRRLFHILRYGGLMMRETESSDRWKWVHDTQLSIASILSHGSRVLIQLPPENENAETKLSIRNFLSTDYEADRDHEFWCWLITGQIDADLSDYICLDTHGSDALMQSKCIFRRLAATHSVKKIREPQIIHLDGIEKKKCVREVRKKIGLNPKDTRFLGGKNRKINKHKHWAMNIALGGAHQPSFGLLEDPIASNGCNGHLYMYYLAPRKNKCGALLVGVEASEYNKMAQNGTTHSIKGKSSVLSATFGHKWSELRKRGCNGFGFGIPDKIDSIFIDLSQGWKDLTLFDWKDEYVNEPPVKYMAYNSAS